MAHFSSVIRRACSQAASFSAMHLKHRSQTSESSRTRVKLLSPAPDFMSATLAAPALHTQKIVQLCRFQFWTMAKSAN